MGTVWSVAKLSEVRFVDQPSQGYYSTPDSAGSDKLKYLISVYRQRIRTKFNSHSKDSWWFWRRVWAQFPKNWTYPHGPTRLNDGFQGNPGTLVRDSTFAQAYQGVSLDRYDFVYFMRKPTKIITQSFMAHILAEQGWKLDE